MAYPTLFNNDQKDMKNLSHETSEIRNRHACLQSKQLYACCQVAPTELEYR